MNKRYLKIKALLGINALSWSVSSFVFLFWSNGSLSLVTEMGQWHCLNALARWQFLYRGLGEKAGQTAHPCTTCAQYVRVRATNANLDCRSRDIWKPTKGPEKVYAPLSPEEAYHSQERSAKRKEICLAHVWGVEDFYTRSSASQNIKWPPPTISSRTLPKRNVLTLTKSSKEMKTWLAWPLKAIRSIIQT